MNPRTPSPRRAPPAALAPLMLAALLAGCVSGPAGTSRVLGGAGSVASSVAAAANSQAGQAGRSR